MAPVRLSLAPDPANVRIARLMAASVARLAQLDEHLLDDIRLATGEASGRAVSAHRDAGLDTEIEVEFETGDSSMSVTVIDHSPSGPGEATLAMRDTFVESADPAGIEIDYPEVIAIIGGLADELDVRTTAEGTTIVMRWKQVDPRR